jgi:ferric-dicitrate binding protein FerR (iron transport regulator)
MKASTRMSTHHEDGTTSLYVIQGRIRIHLTEEQYEDLGVGEHLALKPDLEREVQAPEERTMLSLSPDRLCRCGASVNNVPNSGPADASFEMSCEVGGGQHARR